MLSSLRFAGPLRLNMLLGCDMCLIGVHCVQLVNKTFLYLYDCGVKFLSFIIRCDPAFTFALY